MVGVRAGVPELTAKPHFTRRKKGRLGFQHRQAQLADLSDLSLAAIGLGMTRKRRKTGPTGLLHTMVAV
jgi:hypothetical protein